MMAITQLLQAVMIGKNFLDQIWTYSLEDVWKAMHVFYHNSENKVNTNFGVPVQTIGATSSKLICHPTGRH